MCGPGPGMSKLIVSVSELALAAVIASRSVHSVASQTPLPGSIVVLTVKTPGVGVEVGVGVGVGVCFPIFGIVAH